MKTLRLPILLLVLAIPSRAQTNEALSLRGTVTASGKPVNGAFVLLRDIESRSQEFVSKDWQTQTESDGLFISRAARLLRLVRFFQRRRAVLKENVCWSKELCIENQTLC